MVAIVFLNSASGGLNQATLRATAKILTFQKERIKELKKTHAVCCVSPDVLPDLHK